MPASSATALTPTADRTTAGAARASREVHSPAAALTLAVVRSTPAGAAIARLTRTLRAGGPIGIVGRNAAVDR